MSETNSWPVALRSDRRSITATPDVKGRTRSQPSWPELTLWRRAISDIRFKMVQRARRACREVDLAQGVVSRIVETADRNASIVCCGSNLWRRVMQRILLGILVSSLVAGSAPQFAEAAGHGHARKTDHAPTVKKVPPRHPNAAWMRAHTPTEWGSGYGGGEARQTPAGH